jgi:hypothetical protein
MSNDLANHFNLKIIHYLYLETTFRFVLHKNP